MASGAYERAARAADPEIELVSVACPAFVGHVEAGDTSSPALREAARGYLVPLHDRGVDTLILGTGFQIMPVADPLTGLDGVPLAKRWANRREAYLGTAVAGYPNYFKVNGPNTGSGHSSQISYMEAATDYIVQAICAVKRDNGIKAIDESVIKQQQSIADTFFDLGLIPNRISIADVVRKGGA